MAKLRVFLNLVFLAAYIRVCVYIYMYIYILYVYIYMYVRVCADHHTPSSNHFLS